MPFQCPICKKSFKSIDSFCEHTNQHLKEFDFRTDNKEKDKDKNNNFAFVSDNKKFDNIVDKKNKEFNSVSRCNQIKDEIHQKMDEIQKLYDEYEKLTNTNTNNPKTNKRKNKSDDFFDEFLNELLHFDEFFNWI